MTTYFTPPNVDLHQVSKITIKTSNHNGNDQELPEDDFFVTKISFVRADGTVMFTTQSFSVRDTPVAFEIQEPGEYRNRVLKAQKAQKDAAAQAVQQTAGEQSPEDSEE